MKQEQIEKQEAELRKHYGDNVEVRTIEVRAEGADDEMRIQGYAAVFNQETDLGYFREMIKPGAFDEVMEDDVRLLLNHEGAPMARTTNGSLQLAVDDEGLMYEAILNDTQHSRDVYKMIKRGDITQSSFAFTIAEQSWNEDKTVRSIQKVARLLDVAPVTYAAYPQASVTARSEFMAADEPAPAEQPEQKVENTEVRNLRANEKKSIMNFRTSNDAARYISQLETKLQNITDLAATEERALNSDELAETQDIHGKIEQAEQQRDD